MGGRTNEERKSACLSSDILRDAEAFDPVRQAWEPMADIPPEKYFSTLDTEWREISNGTDGRYLHDATAIPGGMLISGGGIRVGNADAGPDLLYDEPSNSWRWLHSAADKYGHEDENPRHHTYLITVPAEAL